MRHLLLCLLPVTAAAQPACAPHAEISARLAERFGERRDSLALDALGRAVETWVNPATGSWTVTVTSPGGPTCLALWGTVWTDVKEPEGVDG